MAEADVHCVFPGQLVILGFGSIGQGTLPLILRHIGIEPDRITIIAADDASRAVAARYDVAFRKETLTPDNYRQVLEPKLGEGDFLLNLSVDVSSIALMELAAERGALYLDTCIEPWPGGYSDPSLPPAERTNYALREEALALREKLGFDAPTAVITHGANPGLVSHFVKVALLNIAEAMGIDDTDPKTREDWAALAQREGVKVIHIAERDWQIAETPKLPNEFVNTWSVDGFVGEGTQPAELGWGSHEKALPEDGAEHDSGRRSAIFLHRPGASTRVRTWTPMAGEIHGFLITHGESVSISDYLSVKDEERVVYRPTVHYAYHPCDDAILSLHEFAGRNLVAQDSQRILMSEIISGADELGVLLAGHGKGAYWYGSQLDIEEARRLVPENNATSLQVTVSVLAGMIWAMENPRRGIVEPEELDHERILEIAMPYLGPVIGAFTDWTPLSQRMELFEEDLDFSDPWQFENVRVK